MREWTTRSTLRGRQETRSHASSVLQRATLHNIWGLSNQRDPSEKIKRTAKEEPISRRERGVGHSLVPLQSVLQLFGEQALLPDLHQ